jgi:predicted CXXCH cytochrome family protein
MIDSGRFFIVGLVGAWVSVLCGVPALSQAPVASYVGGAACATCHQEVAARYAATPMARSFGRIQSGADVPELKGAEFFHQASQQQFRFVELGGRPRLVRTEEGLPARDALRREATVDYWFGSGRHARSYLSRTPRGELIELPVSWYSGDGGSWAMSPGYDRPDHAGFSRKIGSRCLFCHNADPGAAADSELRFPENLPQGIDCERCHGPASGHVEAARAGAAPQALRASIVNPARLPPERGMEVCLQCHLETTSLRLPASVLAPKRQVFSYRPGEPLGDYVTHFDRAQLGDERFEFASSGYRLMQSRCYEESGGMLTCLTCHSPHGETEPPSLERKTKPCVNCHGARIGVETAQEKHPAGADCIACHMPKRQAADAIHVRVSDHAIVRDARLLPAAQAIERHDGNTAPYRGEVALFYPRDPSGRQVVLGIAQVQHDANLAVGIDRLEQAIGETQPSAPEPYLELAEALRRSDRLTEALPFYRQAAEAGGDWRVWLRWGSALIAAGDPAAGAQMLERARQAAPEEPAVLGEISDVLTSFGRVNEAITVLRAAVAADPLDAATHGKLGARFYQSGDTAGAEREWREAARLRPESAAHRLNLANLLAASGREDEALAHYRAAVRIDPDHGDAHLRLGLLLADRRESAAAEHLRRAAESSDAAVRAEAERALKKFGLGP